MLMLKIKKKKCKNINYISCNYKFNEYNYYKLLSLNSNIVLN